MGRTLIGGSAVGATSSNASSGSSGASVSGPRPDQSNRVEGLPLFCVGGTNNSNVNEARMGLEIIDSMGEIISTNSYMGSRGGGDFHSASNYSTTYNTGTGNGYAGSVYHDTYFYNQDNPSTADRSSTSAQASQAFNWTSWSNLGSRGVLFDLDHQTGSAYYEPRAYNTSYNGGYSDQYGGSNVHTSGSWIGPEGTRQEHSLLSPNQVEYLYLYRDTRKGRKSWPDYRMSGTLDPKDQVLWWDYTPDEFKAVVTSGSETFASNIYGTRFSYNENLNRLFVMTGFSTSNQHMVIWDGASGSNLYDTPLQDWLEGSSSTYLGLTSNGFRNISNNQDGHGAKSWLCNDGSVIMSWKGGSGNFCYRLNTQPENAGSVTAVAMNPDGSTTSYSWAQGTTNHTHEGFLSWDNKWLCLGWVYYYYHCGFIGIFVSVDDPSIWGRYSNTESSYGAVISPIGKSGFIMTNLNNMSGALAYAPVYDFSRTKEIHDADSGTPFHYAMTVRNYASGSAAFPVGYERPPNETSFDRAHGLVNRTNVNVGGSVDNSRSTWQMMREPKHMWRVPTAYAGIAPTNYWYQKLLNGTDNTGARH